MSESDIRKRTTVYRMVPRIVLIGGRPDYRNARLLKVFINTGNTSERLLEIVKEFVDSKNGGSLLIEKKFIWRKHREVGPGEP